MYATKTNGNICYHEEKTVFTPLTGEKTVFFMLLQFLFNLNLREGFDDVTHL